MRVVIMFKLVLFATFIIIGQCEDEEIDLKFPDDFLIGTASSAYQVEGAWNISGRQESNWDYFVHNHAEKIADKSTGDISCNSYHKYKEDIKLLKDIGFNHYRFSISWNRLLPTGYADKVSEDGLRYYHSILDELEKQNIIPFVTLYHWDHPQVFEKFGGWLHKRMVKLFSNYARVVFKEFGNRVKFFITVNEPSIYCHHAYKTTLYAPAVNLSEWGEYHCVHNMLKAHARAYHIYDQEFRNTQKGKIGIVLPVTYAFSKDENDLESSEIAFEFNGGWIANPIFSKNGDYPEIMKERIAERSRLQGYNSSRLPTFSKEWINYIKGTSDYFGLNHYTSHIVSPLSRDEMLTWPNDEGLVHSSDSKWKTAQSPWLKLVPKGIREVLRKVKDKYGNPPVYILENGASDENGINDHFRINYLYSYMKEVLIAMKHDGCNIKAYTIWSFLDSFEWNVGYTESFGIVNVDFNDYNRKRTPKKSASWLKTVLSSRELKPFNSI